MGGGHSRLTATPGARGVPQDRNGSGIVQSQTTQGQAVRGHQIAQAVGPDAPELSIDSPHAPPVHKDKSFDVNNNNVRRDSVGLGSSAARAASDLCRSLASHAEKASRKSESYEDPHAEFSALSSAIHLTNEELQRMMDRIELLSQASDGDARRELAQCVFDLLHVCRSLDEASTLLAGVHFGLRARLIELVENVGASMEKLFPDVEMDAQEATALENLLMTSAGTLNLPVDVLRGMAPDATYEQIKVAAADALDMEARNARNGIASSANSNGSIASEDAFNYALQVREGGYRGLGDPEADIMDEADRTAEDLVLLFDQHRIGMVLARLEASSAMLGEDGTANSLAPGHDPMEALGRESKLETDETREKDNHKLALANDLAALLNLGMDESIQLQALFVPRLAARDVAGAVKVFLDQVLDRAFAALERSIDEESERESAPTNDVAIMLAQCCRSLDDVKARVDELKALVARRLQQFVDQS